MEAPARLLIRDARPADAAAAADLLCRSITLLCTADHADDPVLLARWLANRTPETLARWIAAPGGCLLLAEADGGLLGVGGVTDDGTVTLNCVAPEARFRGVSRAMLAALAARAATPRRGRRRPGRSAACRWRATWPRARLPPASPGRGDPSAPPQGGIEAPHARGRPGQVPTGPRPSRGGPGDRRRAPSGA